MSVSVHTGGQRRRGWREDEATMGKVYCSDNPDNAIGPQLRLKDTEKPDPPLGPVQLHRPSRNLCNVSVERRTREMEAEKAKSASVDEDNGEEKCRGLKTPVEQRPAKRLSWNGTASLSDQ